MPLLMLVLTLATSVSQEGLLERAVRNTRSQPGYRTRFSSTLSVPGSAPLPYRGQAVWRAPRVLYVQYDGAGGDHKKIVCAGDRAWVYHTLVEDWVTAEEAGMAAAGKGIQNPDEILEVLGRQGARAKQTAPGILQVELPGPELAGIMKGQGQNGAFNWERSRASIGVELGDGERVKRLTVKASLVSNDPAVKGEVVYDAQVDVEAYGELPAPEFQNEQKKPIPPSKEMQAAVDQVLKEKR